MGCDLSSTLILRSRAQRGVSKDGSGRCAGWFETRSFAALLTTRKPRVGAIRHSLFAIRLQAEAMS
jgi:hypothetical protein